MEDLKRIGWRLFAPAEYVNWCGHAQEFIPLPERGGCLSWAKRRSHVAIKSDLPPATTL
jgi:hypothetical protein